MAQYVIYQETLKYLALWLKRKSKNNGAITLTQKELDDYTALVLNKLSSESAKNKMFSFEFKEYGEPEYRVSKNSNIDVAQKLKEAQYYYLKSQDMYVSNSDTTALSLKSIKVFPKLLQYCVAPNGYQTILNLTNEIESQPEA